MERGQNVVKGTRTTTTSKPDGGDRAGRVMLGGVLTIMEDTQATGIYRGYRTLQRKLQGWNIATDRVAIDGWQRSLPEEETGFCEFLAH
jgi:hypothetical protein